MKQVKNRHKKLKELTKLINQFQEKNPYVEVEKQPIPIDPKPNPNFNVIESSRTLNYSQKEWGEYGKLVRNS